MEIKVYSIKLSPPRWLRNAIVYVALPLGALMGGALVVRAGVALATFSPNTPLKSADVNTNFANLAAAIAQLQASVIAPGTVAAFSGAIDGNPGEMINGKAPTHLPPAGWAYCDGAPFSRTDPAYAPLFGAIKIAWGEGDKTTTFNVPDLRGLFLRGLDTGAKLDPEGAGRAIGGIQAAAFASHTHTATEAAHVHPTWAVYSGVNVAAGAFNYAGSPDGAQHGATGADTPPQITVAATGGNETRPVNAAINYIIKL